MDAFCREDFGDEYEAVLESFRHAAKLNKQKQEKKIRDGTIALSGLSKASGIVEYI